MFMFYFGRGTFGIRSCEEISLEVMFIGFCLPIVTAFVEEIVAIMTMKHRTFCGCCLALIRSLVDGVAATLCLVVVTSLAVKLYLYA